MAQRISRRNVLQALGCGTALPLLPAPVAAGAHTDPAIDPARTPRRAIFRQQPYFDFDGVGDGYTPPIGNHGTREYRASLSEEAFLRRHWFT